MNVLRDAMAVDSLDQCGVYFGTTGGQVYARPTPATPGADRPRPAGRALGRGADAVMIRVVLPATANAGAASRARFTSTSRARSRVRSVLDALEAQYPMLRGTIRDHVTQKRRPFVRFFACEEDLSHDPTDAPLPDAVAIGRGAVAHHRRDRRAGSAIERARATTCFIAAGQICVQVVVRPRRGS